MTRTTIKGTDQKSGEVEADNVNVTASDVDAGRKKRALDVYIQESVPAADQMDLLERILKEMKKMNIHLQEISDQEIYEGDL